MLQELMERIESLEKTVNQIVRVGIVTATYPARATVRVKLPDADGVITSELPVLFKKTLDDKTYAMPDVDEQVLCVFLPNGLEQGFVLGSMYSQVDTVPVASQDKWHTKFKDGTYLEYDRKTHKLTGDVKGDVELIATGKLTANITGDVEIATEANCKIIAGLTATVQAPVINLNGKLSATNSGEGGEAVFDNPIFETKGGTVKLASQGNVQKFVTEDFLNDFFKTHTHGGVVAGGASSGTPEQDPGSGYRTENVEGS